MKSDKRFSALKIAEPETEVKGSAAYSAWLKQKQGQSSGPAKKKGWWIRVPKKWWLDDLEKLSLAERCVLVTLKIHDNKKFGCFPSVRTLARELHVSPNLILRAIKKLKKKGFLKIVVRRGYYNSYIFKSEAC